MFKIGNDTKISGEMNDLTIYSPNFVELKSSKIKYLVRKNTNNNYVFNRFSYLLDFTTYKSRFNSIDEFRR